MTTKQFTLILDDERSEAETSLVDYLNGLKRNERQLIMRTFLMFSRKLQNDDPVLFDAVAALCNLDGVERDSFTTLGETIARYRNTDQVSKESSLDPKPEPKVSECAVEPEQSEAETARKTKVTSYMQ